MEGERSSVATGPGHVIGSQGMNLEVTTWFSAGIPIIAVAMFAGTLVAIELGRSAGRRRAAEAGDKAHVGLGAIEGAVFGLMGLLLAFTFSGAAQRFEARRHLLVQEANAIGTAWLRLDLAPESYRGELRDLFRQYTDARMAAHDGRRASDAERKAAAAASGPLAGQIWSLAVAGRGQMSPPEAPLLLSALNEMFDMGTARLAERQNHPPLIIFAMLAVLTLACALIAGYGMAGGGPRSWLHIVGFALGMTATVFVTLDIEFPRRGLIQIDDADLVMRDVRRAME